MAYRERLFNKDELEEFLLAVDRNLPGPTSIDIIGEAAAILGLEAEGIGGRGTVDIDVVGNLSLLVGAMNQARQETGLDIPVETVGIYDAPYDYESRIERVDVPKLEYLQVFIPEKHDWVLMKAMRLSGRDLANISEVHQKVGLQAEVLLERFLDEMTHVIGNTRNKIQDFLDLMESLYGEEETERAEVEILDHPGWQERLRMEAL